MFRFLSVLSNILQEIFFTDADFHQIISMVEVLNKKLTETLRILQLHEQLLFINFKNLLLFLLYLKFINPRIKT